MDSQLMLILINLLTMTGIIRRFCVKVEIGYNIYQISVKAALHKVVNSHAYQ